MLEKEQGDQVAVNGPVGYLSSPATQTYGSVVTEPESKCKHVKELETRIHMLEKGECSPAALGRPVDYCNSMVVPHPGKESPYVNKLINRVKVLEGQRSGAMEGGTTIDSNIRDMTSHLDTDNLRIQQLEKELQRLQQGNSPSNHQTGYKLRPRIFKGDGSWEAYETHFEGIKRLNKWSDEVACQQLVVTMEGEALQFVNTLTIAVQDNYEALKKVLRKRFGCSSSTAIYRSQLKTLKRWKGQTLDSLGQEVRRLIRLAYPSLTDEMSETLAVDQFSNALVEPSLRLAVYQAKAQTLQAAIDVATHMEAYTT